MNSALRLQLVYYIERACLANEHIGRRRLAQVSGLTEMSVRLELQRLRDIGNVAVARAGIEMTKSGRREYATMLGQIRNVCEVDLSSLRLDAHTLAALIAVETGDPAWTLRDLAIREGATGLLLLQYEGECWRFTHNQEPIALHNSEDAATIGAAFPDAVEQDRLILASAPDRRSAALGLWHVIESIV